MRIVIKIGTSTLTYANGRLNIRRTEELCKVISDLKNSGCEIIVVSSGAIAMGWGKLSLAGRPEDMAGKQAAAAVGQCELMYTYDKLFSQYNHTVAQLLITASDVRDEERHANFTATLSRLLEMGVIPIINENDTIATEEITVGDNDALGALVATDSHADLLVMLTDIDGLYTADPRVDEDAALITEVHDVDADILTLGGESQSGLGTGGMRTKLEAARRCVEAGVDVIIANGAEPQRLYGITSGDMFGTYFHAKEQ